MAIEALDFAFQQQDYSFFTQFTNKNQSADSFLWSAADFNNNHSGGCDEDFFLPPASGDDYNVGGNQYNWDNYFLPISSSSTSSPTAALIDGIYTGGSDNVTINGDSLSSSSPAAHAATTAEANGRGGSPLRPPRVKRRRARSCKNKEEIESQRMTHIAVERNRRKQMNEYLSVLRSLMPSSYAQRGDQASIIGGAINFVKELEQKLQQFGSYAKRKSTINQNNRSLPFSEFFTFPQYSSSSSQSPKNPETENHETGPKHGVVGDVEVTMVESHANVRIRWKKQPKQLLRLVAGLQSLRLTVLHLNVTTDQDQQIVLYSLSLKVEDDCRLSSVDEIATAVYEMLGRISHEA